MKLFTMTCAALLALGGFAQVAGADSGVKIPSALFGPLESVPSPDSECSEVGANEWTMGYSEAVHGKSYDFAASEDLQSAACTGLREGLSKEHANCQGFETKYGKDDQHAICCEKGFRAGQAHLEDVLANKPAAKDDKDRDCDDQFQSGRRLVKSLCHKNELECVHLPAIQGYAGCYYAGVDYALKTSCEGWFKRGYHWGHSHVTSDLPKPPAEIKDSSPDSAPGSDGSARKDKSAQEQ